MSKTEPEVWRTVRVRASTYDKLQELFVRLSRDGWSGLGIERLEPPSLGGLIDEAVGVLAARPGKRR